MERKQYGSSRAEVTDYINCTERILFLRKQLSQIVYKVLTPFVSIILTLTCEIVFNTKLPDGNICGFFLSLIVLHNVKHILNRNSTEAWSFVHIIAKYYNYPLALGTLSKYSLLFSQIYSPHRQVCLWGKNYNQMK